MRESPRIIAVNRIDVPTMEVTSWGAFLLAIELIVTALKAPFCRIPDGRPYPDYDFRRIDGSSTPMRY